MNAFEEKTLRYIHRHMPAVANGKILAAVSGGADSVALLRVLAALGCNCIAAHCNFHLRGDEADRDEAFVRKLCHDIDIELRCTDFDVEAYKKSHGVSTEMACRELRYDWFERQRAALGCSVIAVAHHRDDNIETFFLNLVRGSGITGLAGIKPCNGKIVRPLLGSSRDEIINYLKTLGQDYVTDSTNLENDYARNKIRNVMLPEISRLFPSAMAGIELTLDNLQGDYAVWSGAVEAFKRDAVEACGHGQIKSTAGNLQRRPTQPRCSTPCCRTMASTESKPKPLRRHPGWERCLNQKNMSQRLAETTFPCSRPALSTMRRHTLSAMPAGLKKRKAYSLRLSTTLPNLNLTEAERRLISTPTRRATASLCVIGGRATVSDRLG